MSSLQYRTTITFSFTAHSDGDWPETVPWPEWKPSTEKKMRPVRAKFSVDVKEDRITYFSTIEVTGPRINPSGEGANVSNNYHTSWSAVPAFVANLKKEAEEIIQLEMRSYNSDAD